MKDRPPISTAEQLERWARGDSYCPNENGECCPDFSCCRAELLAPERERRGFLEAGDGERYPYLAKFLGRAIAGIEIENDVRVHLAGSDEP